MITTNEKQEYKKLLDYAAERLDLYRELQVVSGLTPPTTTLQVSLRNLGDIIVNSDLHPVVHISPAMPFFILGVIVGLLGAFLI